MKVVFEFGDASPIQNIDFEKWVHIHNYPYRDVYNGTLILSHPDKGNITFRLDVRVGTFQLVVESLGGLCPTPSSPAFTEHVMFPATLEVEGSVRDLTLEVKPGEIPHPPGNVTAYVRLKSSQRIMHMNCTFNWDEIMDETFITFTGPMESNAVVVYRYNYITLGSKVVTLECSNAYSHSIVQVEVFVTNQCFSPDPIFDRQYSKQAKPMTVLNSEPAKLVTRTVIKCTDIKPNFTWAIKVVKNDSILPFEYPHLDYLTWERGQLEPDLYRFSLNISFGREHDFCWLSEMIYVRVERAPLVADIQGGTRKTGDPHAIVDARTGSYDRIMGYGNNEGLAFTWSCRTYNSTSVQELLSLESAASPGSSVPCDRISTEIEAGKRQLNISDDVQSMGFLFEVAVSYDDLTSNATAHVQFIRGSLNTEIVCILNCGMKVAVSSKLVLNVTCDRCTQEPSATVIYVWKIFKVDNSTNGTKVEISDTNIFEKTDTSIGRGAVIKENALEGGQTYRVEVNVTLLDDHSNGFAAREFRTNCPPWGGNCTVTPLQGNVMTDSFSMACTGWKDEGFSEDANSTSDGDEESLLLAPLIYKFLLRRYNTIFPIAQGGESKMPRIMLPYIPGPNNSEHELVARIYDPWNDFIEVSQPIKLYANDSSSSLENTLEFWYGQVSYTNRSSNLEKQMKSLTIASSLISTFVSGSTFSDLSGLWSLHWRNNI
ncbi:uncharacterized protein LOC112566962 [Pomacea canaliculata]|uniref:uncharacterized protein LOC112566962 n=1 Tax=Pomacea canaliculata TaxID=400727 RepID=UPI000D72EA4C|nr:uncharacterized protein LOC112566962 [Pomacea canaliculata]